MLIKKKCMKCQKEFETRRETQKFCSLNCAVAYNKEHGVGFFAGHRSKLEINREIKDWLALSRCESVSENTRRIAHAKVNKLLIQRSQP